MIIIFGNLVKMLFHVFCTYHITVEGFPVALLGSELTLDLQRTLSVP
jgi:hypothetical protein